MALTLSEAEKQALGISPSVKPQPKILPPQPVKRSEEPDSVKAMRLIANSLQQVIEDNKTDTEALKNAIIEALRPIPEIEEDSKSEEWDFDMVRDKNNTLIKIKALRIA